MPLLSKNLFSARHPGIRRGLRGGLAPKTGRLTAILMLFLVVCGWSPALGEPSSPPEYQVKAAFIYNFVKFVDWPGDSGSNQSSPLQICVVGQDPFGDAIELIRGKTAKGRKINIAYFRRVEDVKDCNVLFISSSEKRRLGQIMKYLQNARVLTVSDQEGFCEAGGMINLVPVKNKVTFEINLNAARRAQLRISSQLLKLSRKVIE